MSIISKVLERVEVTLNQRVNVDAKGELGILHSRITKDHGETVKLSPSAVDLEVTAFCSIYLGLNS